MAEEAHTSPLEPQAVEQTHAWRRLAGIGMLSLSCGGLVGGVAGATESAFTPTGIELGPHQATAQLTFGHTIDFDLGPLGNAEKPVSWLAGTGAKIVVKGIPIPPDQSALATVGTVTDQYEQLLADPDHIEQNAIHTVSTRIWHDSLEGGIIGGVTSLGMFALSEPGRRRRRSERAAALQALDELDAPAAQKSAIARTLVRETKPFKNQRRIAIGSAAALMVAAACGGAIANSNTVPNSAVDDALEGTPFQGYSIDGELLVLAVNEGAVRAKEFIDTDINFYNQTADNFEAAFKAKFGADTPDHHGLVYLLSISDNHCNIGMDKVHGAVADAFKVDGVIDSGDMTMGGTAAEQECVDAEADDTAGKDRVQIFAAGNHDSPTTEQQAATRGMKVLHLNKTVSIKGVTILGESDVNESTFGTPEHLRAGAETAAQETTDITAAACKQQPDILVVHEPQMAAPAVESGCTSLSISGHWHQWYAPRLLNAAADSYQFVEGTSGGAKPGNITVGTLKESAVDTVFVLSADTKRPIGYYVITAHTDKSVSISDFTPLTTQVGQPLVSGSGD